MRASYTITTGSPADPTPSSTAPTVESLLDILRECRDAEAEYASVTEIYAEIAGGVGSKFRADARTRLSEVRRKRDTLLAITTI